jgi:hypothetical protein
MLIKSSLLIASSFVVADGRQMLRKDRDLATWGGDAHPVPVPVAPAKPSWKGDGNNAAPLKVVKKPTKGSGKKTVVMRQQRNKKSSVIKQANMKPAKVVQVGWKDDGYIVKPANIKPSKVQPVKNDKWNNDGFVPVQPVTNDKWKNDGFIPVQPVVNDKWKNDGFAPLVTEKPTRKPTWGNDGFVPLVTPKPTNKPASGWGNDGHCMYRPNGDYTMCTNDDSVSSNNVFNNLNDCCMAVFGPAECIYEDVCATCEEKLFFFDGEQCINDIYIADAPAYSTPMACCNINFGIGSYGNGQCDYVDICVPPPIETTPAPTPCDDMVFFLDGNTCTNDIYIADAVAYGEFQLNMQGTDIFHSYANLDPCIHFNRQCHDLLQRQFWPRRYQQRSL